MLIKKKTHLKKQINEGGVFRATPVKADSEVGQNGESYKGDKLEWGESGITGLPRIALIGISTIDFRQPYLICFTILVYH